MLAKRHHLFTAAAAATFALGLFGSAANAAEHLVTVRVYDRYENAVAAKAVVR